MKKISVVAAILLAGFAGLRAVVDFQALSLEQALQSAAEQKKVVFVDFFTTWCMPCKMMDASTWKDDNVGGWLAKNTVAIRLDGDKERPTVKKYAVAGFPTMLFIKPDGRELDRIVGACDAAAFLSEAKAICSGEDPYARAQRFLKENGEESVMVRMKYADRLIGLGRTDEALAALLWCFDKTAAEGESFVPMSRITDALGFLAKTLPAAREALRLRLDQALTRLEKEAWTMGQVAEVLDMCRFSGSDLPARLALYDKLKGRAEKDGKGSELAKLFMDEMCEARRYAELASLLEPEKAAEDCLREIAAKQEWRKTNSDSLLYETSLKIIDDLIATVCKYYEIILGCSEEAKGAGVAGKLLSLDKSASTLNGLAWCGMLSGRSSRWHLELAGKAWTLSEKKDAAILDTYCRLLERFGEMPRAEALVREFQKNSGDEKVNRKLDICLEEIRRPEQKKNSGK